MRLKMPVKISITVEQRGEDPMTSTTRVYRPGENLTNDGVQISTDVRPVELSSHKTVTYTDYCIRWTEMEFEKGP